MFENNQKKQEVYNQILDFSKTISNKKEGAPFWVEEHCVFADPSQTRACRVASF